MFSNRVPFSKVGYLLKKPWKITELDIPNGCRKATSKLRWKHRDVLTLPSPIMEVENGSLEYQFPFHSGKWSTSMIWDQSGKNFQANCFGSAFVPTPRASSATMGTSWAHQNLVNLLQVCLDAGLKKGNFHGSKKPSETWFLFFFGWGLHMIHTACSYIIFPIF